MDLLKNVNSAEPGLDVFKNKMEAPIIDMCKQDQMGRSSLQNM